jgi:hypothetical protein
MPRQVSDEEYAFLQNKRQIADFVEGIYNDPQLSRDAKALIKRKYPDLQIPDYDIETRVNARLDQDRTEREDRERQERERQENDRAAASRAKTQKDYGFTDEAMGQLEELMVERNIGDYEAGAMLMASRNPPQTSSDDGGWDRTRWHHDKVDGFAEIAKDPEAWGRTQIMGALAADAQRARNGR